MWKSKLTSIFGLVAGLCTHAQAADMVQQSADNLNPVDNQSSAVISCPNVGTGYFNIPGTTTCVAITGHAVGYIENDIQNRKIDVQTEYVNGTPFALYDVVKIAPTREKTRLSGEGKLIISAITPTAQGPASTYLSFMGFAAGELSSVDVDEAYLYWNKFTVGIHQSFFDTTPGFNDTAGISSDETVALFAYTHKIGEQGSLSISVEDNNLRRTEEGVWQLRAGQDIPDIVVAATFENDKTRWKTAGVITSLEDDSGTPCCGYLEGGGLGWAIQSSIEHRLDYGDQFGRFMISGAYTNGALSYLGPMLFATDYIVDSDNTLAITEGYSALVSYEHNWNEQFRTAVTMSGYQTTTTTNNFTWETAGIQTTAGLEYEPASNTVIGIETSYIRDVVQGTYFGTAGSQDTADFWRNKLYLKRIF